MMRSSAGTTLYVNMPSWAARAMLVVVLVLVALPAIPHTPLYIPGEKHWGQVQTGYTDEVLYKTIVKKMIVGGDYYETAAVEHRMHNYPTSPPQVFREPTLAWLLSKLHFHFIQLAALFGLYGVIIVLYFKQFLMDKPFGMKILAVTFATTGLSIAGISDGVYLHEIWAALLIAVSLLVYRASLWWPAVVCGLFACLIRELALPYLIVMAVFSLHERRLKEFLGWLTAIAAFAIVFVTHLSLASRYHQAGDLVSRSWLSFGGWDFAIATAKWNIFLHFLPYPLIALALCLSVIGLAGAIDARARRAAVIVAGYLAAFLVVGRPENYYWGILYAPLLPAGFILAPAAIRDLYRTASLFSRPGEIGVK
jgi:hypothetical protein